MYEKVSACKWMESRKLIVNTSNGTSIGHFLFDKSNVAIRKDRSSYDYRSSNIYTGCDYIDRGTYLEGVCFDGETFKIDKEDFDLVKGIKWNVDKNRYAVGKMSKDKIVKMHRLIMGVIDKKIEVDHINHDTTDNRRCNLRLCDRALNCFNRRIGRYNKSGVVGVYWHNAANKWAAQISDHNIRSYLGSFDKIEDAIAARKAAEQKYGILTEW